MWKPISSDSQAFGREQSFGGHPWALHVVPGISFHQHTWVGQTRSRRLQEHCTHFANQRRYFKPLWRLGSGDLNQFLSKTSFRSRFCTIFTNNKHLVYENWFPAYKNIFPQRISFPLKSMEK